MSHQARDVVRYIKALEDNGPYRTQWSQSGPPFYCWPVLTPDGRKAMSLDLLNMNAQIEAAIRAINKRYAEQHRIYAEAIKRLYPKSQDPPTS